MFATLTILLTDRETDAAIADFLWLIEQSPGQTSINLTQVTSCLMY
ncbi:MAG: hypothetical protein ACI9UT_001694 [Flavobacteriales bacterium]|jgi:hypothetical protein